MRRKGLFLFLCFTILVFAFWLGVWTSWTESRAHYTPEYAKQDVATILKKENLTESDYNILLLQTGMTKVGVDELRDVGREDELLYLQERFFEEVEVECLRSSIIVQSERLTESGCKEGKTVEGVTDNVQMPDVESDAGADEQVMVRVSAGVARESLENFLPALQTGDILVSFSGHVFGWRYGHAAIVVDAERGLTVEAINLGSDSKMRSVEHWREYPTFALLRVVRATPKQRQEAAAYAESNLVGLPYSLFSFDREAGAFLSGTHCAHLVWHAYAQVGYDLDGDGGLIVTPRDIYESDMVEVIQLYGVDPG